MLAGCGDSTAADALFPADRNGVYGYVDQKGEWAIPPRFEVANFFQDDGAAWVRFEGRFGRIDRKGGWALLPTLTHVSPLAENGLARARDGNSKFGFINAKGEWVIPPRFGYADSFDDNGLASVWFKEDGPKHYIDSTGRSVVPIAHDLPVPRR
ncbi:MAG: WG repeat-containing protein [Zoogloeaceae bacterium]|nr:WG repeat-containing protein [Zoogloeaceae bacterium]